MPYFFIFVTSIEQEASQSLSGSYQAIIYFNFKSDLWREECLNRLRNAFGKQSPFKMIVNWWRAEFVNGRTTLIVAKKRSPRCGRHGKNNSEGWKNNPRKSSCNICWASEKHSALVSFSYRCEKRTRRKYISIILGSISWKIHGNVFFIPLVATKHRYLTYDNKIILPI